jgi:serine/threonine protein phosphatase PrpC
MTEPQTSATASVPQNGAATPSALARPLAVESFGLTDPGRMRPTNQDQFVTATLMRALWIKQSSVPQSSVRYANGRGHVFIVADGMGGVVGGEKASAIAVGAIEEFLLNALHWLISLDGSGETSVLDEFKAALRSADACVYAAAANDPGLRGMGTTLTMAYSIDADLFVAHVGDSRCYLLRGGALTQLTHDDTLVQQLVDGGLVRPENVGDHGLRHVITNVVGGPSTGVQVEVHWTRLEAGDVLLLCTDGLTGMVTDEHIKAVLQSSLRPRDACIELARLANEQGGDDNLTVIVARYA